MKLYNIEEPEEFDQYVQQSAEKLLEEDWEHNKRIHKAYAQNKDWQSPLSEHVSEYIETELMYTSTMEQLGLIADILEERNMLDIAGIETTSTDLLDIMDTKVYFGVKHCLEREAENQLKNMDEEKLTALNI